MVSLEGCPFCRVARDSYLEPLRRQEAMPVFQIDMRSASTVRDFGGATVTHDQLVQAWRITIAPTVLFFGPRGKEIVSGIQRVADIGGEIASASREQSAGIAEINQAVSQLDSVTQQNAALVEETSAASSALQEQASQLAAVAASFQLESGNRGLRLS
jgi:hypothetical protein